jgi:hypothetical protein
VDDFLVGNTVQNGDGLLEYGLCGSLVAGQNGLLDALDSRTQRGAQAGIVSALLLGLASDWRARLRA